MSPPVDKTASPPRGLVRLCIVVQYPIHNHLPLHQALDREADIALEVLFMQNAHTTHGYDPDFAREVDWGLKLHQGYTSRIFPNASPWRDGEGFWKYINPGLIRQVATGPYDAVYVHGHNQFTHLAAIAAARLTGKRTIIRTDTYNLGSRSLLIRLARRLAYTLTYRLAHVLLYVGELNRQCFEDFGGKPEQLAHAPQVVDNVRFFEEGKRLAPRRSEIRSGFGIPPGHRVALFCAKLIPKKRPLAMIEAFFDAGLRGWTLLMVGDGPLRAACEARAEALGAGNRVVFAGFLDQKAVCRAYAIADLMVLPSSHQETWGLVVNEAMNFGCPVIVSDRVGCAPDLVAAGAGLVFPHDRMDALVDALRQMASDDALRARCGERARQIIADWSVERYVAGVRRALGLPDRADA